MTGSASAWGHTVLINGASGSVGTVAVQLARARGAKVIGTAGPANQDYVRSLGATPTPCNDGLADRIREIAPTGVDSIDPDAAARLWRVSAGLTGVDAFAPNHFQD
ncbi:zinc-binding dehydrogenase [Actinoallomurus sp. CA-142502]|uniref:zinc-binding dehydrogenase n=1 Tax=Actinoallomurus sp. CA-142502 TaxID=3239885 RepID=UPI003D8FC51F